MAPHRRHPCLCIGILPRSLPHLVRTQLRALMFHLQAIPGPFPHHSLPVLNPKAIHLQSPSLRLNNLPSRLLLIAHSLSVERIFR